MYPQTHFLIPFLIGLTLTKFNLLSWKLVLLSGIIAVLIDLDHFVEHIIHKKKNKFSLTDTWNQAIHNHWFVEWSFLHRWQGMIIIGLVLLLVLFFNWQIALTFAIAYYSHMILDYIRVSFKPKYMLRLKEKRLFIDIPYYELILDLILVVGTIILVVI